MGDGAVISFLFGNWLISFWGVVVWWCVFAELAFSCRSKCEVYVLRVGGEGVGVVMGDVGDKGNFICEGLCMLRAWQDFAVS